MKNILDWLNLHIGLEGTIVFIFIVFITSILIMYIIKLLTGTSLKKDAWGVKAGELKREVHLLDKEYHDFKNSLSWKQQKSRDNQRRLTSLKDRLNYARKRRKEHLNNNKKRSNLKIKILISFIIILSLCYYYFSSHIVHFLTIKFHIIEYINSII